MIRKLFFSILIAIAAMNLSFVSVLHAAESKTITLDVPGMSCEFCPITIRKALEKVPGVTEAKASYKTKTATVSFDPQQTDVEALMSATANIGYPSTVRQ